MSALVLATQRTAQPQGGAQIAPKWAQKNPVLLATASSGFANIINGLTPAIGSTANFRGSSVGIGASGSAAATTSAIGFEDYAFGGTTPITVIAFSDERPGASRSFLAQGTEVILRVSAAGTGVEFILNSFATNDRATAVADSRSSPGFFAAGTYGPSGRLRAYANTAMAEVTPTGTYANTADIFTAVYTQGLNQLFDKRLALLAIFRSEFSQAELRELSANPWQLFKPIERRIWVPVSAGGGTSYTLSPTGTVFFTGSSSVSTERFLSPVGTILFDGSAPLSFTGAATSHTINPSGYVTFAGNSPAGWGRVVQPSGGMWLSGSAALPNTRTLLPTGGFSLLGVTLFSKDKVLVSNGNITLSGTAPMSSNTLVESLSTKLTLTFAGTT